MKKMMLTIVLLSFFSFWMLPADSRMIPPRFNVSNSGTFPLAIVEASVDDMYDGCDKPMEELVRDKYEKTEMKGDFESVWNKCKKSSEEKYDSKIDLTKAHIRAICTYSTGDKERFYRALTTAVVKGRKDYTTTYFEYHYMHFLLTRAIQILKKSQAAHCPITYRRTHNFFTGGQKDQIIRFGHFASSSLVSTVTAFGRETCFVTTTCYGAALNQYVKKQVLEEKEVLIPPYEVFKIVNIQKKKPFYDKCKENLNDCNTCITLESVGFLSNLNCALIKQDSHGVN